MDLGGREGEGEEKSQLCTGKWLKCGDAPSKSLMGEG